MKLFCFIKLMNCLLKQRLLCWSPISQMSSVNAGLQSQFLPHALAQLIFNYFLNKTSHFARNDQTECLQYFHQNLHVALTNPRSQLENKPYFLVVLGRILSKENQAFNKLLLQQHLCLAKCC